MNPANRFIALPLRLGLAWCLGATAAARAAERGIFVYSGSQVEVPEATFFPCDDHSIPWRRNLHLTMVPASKHGPSVLHRGGRGAFDELRAEYYGAVIRIGGLYHMWYLGYGFEDPAVRTYEGVSVHVGYAESPDGINWHKPSLGVYRYHGGTDNNIVAVEPDYLTKMNKDGNVHVLYDPEDPDPGRRYKMMLNVPYTAAPRPERWTMMPLQSADGLRWRYAVPVKVDRPRPESFSKFTRDSIVLPAEHLEGGSFIKLGGIYYENGQSVTLSDGTSTGRVMGTFWSPDFVHWHHEKAISFMRYGYDVAKHVIGFSREETEQVHEGAALWNRGNVLVGIYGRWEGGSGWAKSQINLGLITSVDAIHFSEPDPTFDFARPGEPGQWDSGGLLQGQGFQNVGDQTYIWYGSWDLTASGGAHEYNAARDMLASHGEVGLFTMRRDGFGYFSVLDPKTARPPDTYETGEGSLITAPFRVDGAPAAVCLNVEEVDRGELKIALLDRGGEPIPGYGWGDCGPLSTGVRQPVAWGGHRTLPAGGPYRLGASFKYRDGQSPRLYAIYVGLAANSEP